MHQVSRYPLQLTSPVFELDFTAVLVLCDLCDIVTNMRKRRGTDASFILHVLSYGLFIKASHSSRHLFVE